MFADDSEVLAASINIIALMMEAASSSETSRGNISEDSHLHFSTVCVQQ
jgi:hypothetical protein